MGLQVGLVRRDRRCGAGIQDKLKKEYRGGKKNSLQKRAFMGYLRGYSIFLKKD